MNEYEKLRSEIDTYLMERFKYRRSLVYLTPDNNINTLKNRRVNLYLRLRRTESLFPPNCLIIARIGFQEERAGHGTHFVHFLTKIAVKYNFTHIGFESVNEKSKAFAEKFGFCPIDNFNYVASVENLICYFQCVD